MARFIGIRHRVKKTADGEARPTQLVVSTDTKVLVLELEDEDAELDFALGRLPTKWRAATLEETKDLPHHHVRRKPKSKDLTYSKNPDDFNYFIPVTYDGLRSEDVIAMVLGGSGDNFAHALSRQAEKIGAAVWRIPPSVLKDCRGDAKKDDDAQLLSRLIADEPHLFNITLPRDRDMIALREAMKARRDAMQARIACEQRLRQHVIGRAFRAKDGLFPEGNIEAFFDREKANDTILLALEAEELRREKDIRQAIGQLDVWQQIFEPIEGCGIMTGGALIAAIQDIRRFWVQPDQSAIDALRAEAHELKVEANFEMDRDKVADRITTDTTKFQILQMVRSWKRENGEEAEALLLDRAIACYQQIHRLKQKAHRKGAAKLRRYCGTFVLPDGRFPRRRTGSVANWSGECRQALFLLGDQMNRRPASEWGLKLRANKVARRVIHPEPMTITNAAGKSVTRYTNGHIHKQAIWTTLGQLVTYIFNQWTKLELERQAALTTEPEQIAV